jgi:sugar phosphate isomerase/epimerase
MMTHNRFSRRSFLALTAAAPLATLAQGKRIPLGLELYSVRNELQKDLMGTVRAVAKMGYEGVEFYAPYFEWTQAYAKEVRKLLDDLGIRCYSTHNGAQSFSPEKLSHAIDLNRTIGSKYIVMASAGKVVNLEGWRSVADTLNRAAEKAKPLGLGVGYHNHQAEFRSVEGTLPIEMIASRTAKEVMLQLDVGTCIEAGVDPVAWIEKNPGRIVCVHCKDWSPAKGYQELFGEGVAPWKKIFDAAQRIGGVQYYLIEQEGSSFPPMETAQRCLDNFRALHASWGARPEQR